MTSIDYHSSTFEGVCYSYTDRKKVGAEFIIDGRRQIVPLNSLTNDYKTLREKRNKDSFEELNFKSIEEVLTKMQNISNLINTVLTDTELKE